MRCTVLLFAQLADEVGIRQWTIELPTASTAADAIDHMIREHGALAKWRDRIALAINQSYCDARTVLREGDAIALIPPVSGG